MEKRYKVVRIDHQGEWVSCIVSLASTFSLHYKIGKVTWGTLGTLGVLVFKNLYYAKSFVCSYIGRTIPFEILEGTAIDERKCDFIRCHENEYFLEEEDISFPPDTSYAPEGTIRCAGFIPERVVKDYGNKKSN